MIVNENRTNSSKPLQWHPAFFADIQIELEAERIYYVSGPKIPIQVIVTQQLSKEKNLWLRSLTDRIKDKEDMKRLLNEYREKQKNPLYESVMQMIVRANEEKFKEADCMCEALNRIIQDQIEEKIRNSLQAGYDEDYGMGMQQGMQQGEHSINSLILCLAKLGRTSDIIKSASDPEYQKSLLKEFGLLQE
ncbi:putative 60S ribosomal subunit assembly/export protein LOC1 [Ruminococcus sp. CAG:17]|nr:putative 60S ribosomal subunit assembly/export protein LOC1 [Ruminococcus sp. CAG:17]